MTAGTRTQSLGLPDLLELVGRGALALPEFQRDYVWSDDNVRSLLATVIKGWPAGMLLFMEMPVDRYLAIRPFAGGPPVDEESVTHVVLDGQQRLTALYEALRGEERVWAIGAAAVSSKATPEELEDAITVMPRWRWERKFAAAPAGNDMLVPLSVLSPPERFFRWRDNQSEHPMSSLASDDVRLLLNRSYKSGLDSLGRYKFPVVLVDRHMQMSSVARIFERVNTSGLALNTFDLVVAHLFKDGWNLRSEWNEANAREPLLGVLLGEDGMAAIESIALRLTRDVRRQAILDLPPDVVHAAWPETIDAMSRTVKFLHTECGVLNGDYLPHRAFPVILAAAATRVDLQLHQKQLRRWFFQRAFGSRFDAAVNTRVVSEYDLIRQLTEPAVEMPTARLDQEVLAEALRRRTGTIWRALLSAMSFAGANDPKIGLFKLDVPSEKLRPVSVLNDSASSESLQHRALAHVLLSSGAGEVLHRVGAHRLRRFLLDLDPLDAERFVDGQLLPPLADESAYARDATFLEARSRVLIAFAARPEARQAWQA